MPQATTGPGSPESPRPKSRPKSRPKKTGGRAGKPAHKRGGHDGVRLAALRALLDFERGGELKSDPPPWVKEAARRRLYTHLLKGMVRHLRLLRSEVLRLADAPPEKLDPLLVALAMLGLYQLRFLHVSHHAAVYETVALAAPLGRDWGRGWVNGILRTAQREGLRGEDTGETSDSPPLAVRTSHPDWMVERWRSRYGDAAAGAICAANNRYEGAALRVETRRIAVAELAGLLRDAGAQVEPHPWLPGALWADPLGPVLKSRPFREGYCYVQDASSQLLIAWAAPLLRGRVLDMCAAPGGKLTHLVSLTGHVSQTAHASQSAHGSQAGPGGWVAGADHALERMGQVRENFARLRLPPAPLLVADGTRLPFLDGSLDAVLVDAPCSATGMIRKYPELKWRKHEADLPRLVELQRGLLAEAARVVRPGGIIVYATCSLEPEENEMAVAAFLESQPGFRRRRFDHLPPPRGLGRPAESFLSGEGDLLLLPGERQMGLYGAILARDGGHNGEGHR